MAYDVQTPVFEGPFDLLLHLILREQVDLYEISLSGIIDAFLREIEKMEHVDLDTSTEFLLIASTLVELKTRRLLPNESDLDLDDELALWEERDLLLTRLLECKTFKDAAVQLQSMADDASRSYPRLAGLEEPFIGLMPDLLEGVDLADVHAAMVRALTPKPVPRVEIFHIHQVRVSVADAVFELADELPRIGRISFRRLTEEFVDRLDVVVRFLALLELYKQGMIDLDQPGAFGEIEVVWLGHDGEAADLELVDVYDG